MKDEYELAKSSVELAKDFLKTITKPSLEELGGLLADKVRYYRFKNQVKILCDAQNYISEKGLEVKKIPLKILVPMLENASLEEEEILQNKWSALLANAADNNRELLAPFVYTSILNNLTSNEVLVLDYLRDNNSISYRDLYSIFNINESNIDNLFRLRLIHDEPAEIQMEEKADWELKRLKKVPKIKESEFLTLSFLGEEFVDECRLK